MGGDIGAWEVPKGLGVGEEGAFLYSQGLGIIFNYHFLSFFFFSCTLLVENSNFSNYQLCIFLGLFYVIYLVSVFAGKSHSEYPERTKLCF